LDSIAKPEDIMERCKAIGATSIGITDHGSISSSLEVYEAAKKAKIKPIFGLEAYICDNIEEKVDRNLKHLLLLAKNFAGWKQLIKLVSLSNTTEHYYYKPRLDLNALREYAAGGNFVCIDGHWGSLLSHKVFSDLKAAAREPSEEDAKKYANPAWIDDCTKHIQLLQEIFNENNVFLEVQSIDCENIPATILLAKAYRYLSKKLGVPCVATGDSHYCTKDQAVLQRIVLCTQMNRTLKSVYDDIAKGEDVGMGGFFRSSNYHIPTEEEMAAVNTREEIENTVRIADMCQEYDITSKPVLPKFQPPEGLSSGEYLRQLCREGWDRKKDKIEKAMIAKGHTKKDYGDRFEEEFGIITKYGLDGYFLVVWDIIEYAKNNGCLVGSGRGSSASSLLAYLLGITDINPLEYNLLFTRFINSGRFSEGKVSPPDIDTDYALDKRDMVIDYIKKKYGEDKVGLICTFGTMQGRGALKDVLRAYNACSVDEQNKITSYIPDPAKISDELQEAKDEGAEIGIIEWALENKRKELSPYATLTESGEIEGPLARYFKDAIALEGTARTVGKHAAGVIIANSPLDDIVPIIYDGKSHKRVIGYDMKAIESTPLMKLDVLGLAALTKVDISIKLLAKERIDDGN
jgi:DNA polymerase-3 subunit alpha